MGGAGSFSPGSFKGFNSLSGLSSLSGFNCEYVNRPNLFLIRFNLFLIFSLSG